MKKGGDLAHGVSFNTYGTKVTSQPLKMAEPTHRIPPGGVTSAASLRSVPKSCIHSVKDICMFYVNKVSGEYSNHPAAARYVHQMAEEIILQLAGVASEIKKNRGEPELYAALLEEWEEHFPANLGAMGTPKAISLLLQQQTRDIARLKSELENEKLHRDSDVSGILRSMDAQLHAYRSSVLHDRRQMSLMHEAELTNIKEKNDLQQRLHQEALLQLHDNHMKEMQTKRQIFEKQAKFIVKTKNQEITKLTKMFKKRVAIFREKLQLLQDKLLTQKLANSELRAKYHALARSFNETVNLSDSSSSDDSSAACSEDENVQNDNQNVPKDRRNKRKSKKNRDDNLFNDPDMEDIAQLLMTGSNDDEFFSSDSDEAEGDDNSSLSSHSHFEERNGDDNSVSLLDDPEKHQEQDKLEALTQLAEEKRQRRLRKQQLKQEQQAEFERFKSQMAAQNAEKRVSKKQQRDQERRDVAQFSRSVLSGDFSSVGGTVRNLPGNKSNNNNRSGNGNNNNTNSAVSKALRDKLLTLSATNRKLEQRSVRNEALLKRINENYEIVEKQVKTLTDERTTLLRRLQEEESRNEALRRALGSQLAINLSDKSNENKGNQNNMPSCDNNFNNVNNLSQFVGKLKEDFDATAKLQGAQNIDSFHDVLLLHNNNEEGSSDTTNRDAIDKILNAEKVAAALRDVKNTAQLLVACHTPHFLEKERDISAPLHNVNNMVEDAIVKSQHSQANKSKHNVSLKDAITHQIRMKKDKKCSVRLTPYLTAGHF